MPLGEFRITVAAAASPRQVQRIHPRLQMTLRQDFVAPVAVGARGGVPVSLGVGPAVHALGVNLKGLGMTGRALDTLGLSGVRNLRDVAMTGGTSQRRVDGSGKALGVDVKGNGLSLTHLF